MNRSLLRALADPAANHRALDWARSVFITGAAQVAVQLLGFVSGVVVIRTLSPHQYAYYTIVTAALGTMTVLTDGGVGNGVLAAGGAVWQDRGRLGAVLATGMQLRRRLAVFAVLAALPVSAYLLWRQGASWRETALISLSILPAYLATVTGQLLEAVPRLHQRVLPLQRIQILNNLGRAIILVALVPRWPFAAVAAVAAAAPQWWANWRLRRLAGVHADWRAPADPEVHQRLVAQVSRTLPAAIYYSLSGQLAIWVISIFGHATAVAAVGALSRLTMILSLAGTVFATLVIPRFARLSALQPQLIARRYWQSQTLLAATFVVPVALLAWFPHPVLALLGPHYSGFAREALLMAVSSVFGVLSGAAFSLGAARGVVARPQLLLPYCIIGQICLLLLLPVNSVAGVVAVGLLSNVSQWILHVVYFRWASRRARQLSAGQRT
ncbi:MAG TPA: hypothetical protein VK727_08380 [Steroidobacteraceae bacterium]|nr:hypothetical protein [Steroidobacteraceae bacterium]